MLRRRLLNPDDEQIEEVGQAHQGRYRKLELKVERVNDATLSDVSDLQVAHRAQDEEKHCRYDFDSEFHGAKHCVLSRRAKFKVRWVHCIATFFICLYIDRVQ